MKTVGSIRIVVVEAITVSVAACSFSGDRNGGGADRTQHSAAADASGTPSTTAGSDQRIMLGSQELGPVQFGASKQRTTAELTRLLGPPSGSGTNPGCGPAFTEVHWGELAVEFHDGVFSGYRDVNRPEGKLQLAPVDAIQSVRPEAKTAAGIGLGDSLGRVQSAYPRLSLAGANRWQVPSGLSFVDNSSRSPGTAHARIIEIRAKTCGSY